MTFLQHDYTTGENQQFFSESVTRLGARLAPNDKMVQGNEILGFLADCRLTLDRRLERRLAREAPQHWHGGLNIGEIAEFLQCCGSGATPSTLEAAPQHWRRQRNSGRKARQRIEIFGVLKETVGDFGALGKTGNHETRERRESRDWQNDGKEG